MSEVQLSRQKDYGGCGAAYNPGHVGLRPAGHCAALCFVPGSDLPARVHFRRHIRATQAGRKGESDLICW